MLCCTYAEVVVVGRCSQKGFPPRSTVYDYFKPWQQDGTLDEIMRVLRE